MLTDQQAAALMLQLLPRVNFQGSELDALNALRSWAMDKSTPKPQAVEDEDEPELPLPKAI